MYAVIETGGKQYKVREGDIIQVELLKVETGMGYDIDKVLAVVYPESGESAFGKPYVDGAVVSASVLGSGKEKKVIVYKYKSKKTFHKKKGHRQPFTRLRIEKITV